MPKREKLKIDPEKIMEILTVRPWTHVFSDPNVARPIRKIVIPKGGGIKTYLKGIKHPFPGYPDHHMLEVICIVKRIHLMAIEFFSSLINKRNIFKLVLLIKNIKDFIPKWLNFLGWIILKRRLRPQFYSHSVREIYRLFDILIEREYGPEMKDKWGKIRDIVCMVLEFDHAYRLRFQDIIAEMNIDKIKPDEGDLEYSSYQNITRDNYDFGGKKNESQIRNNTTDN